MIRQGFSISLLCMAIVVMLFHAFVPHHHHDTIICFENTNAPDCCAHEHESDKNTDKAHDGIPCKGDEFCLLNQDYLSASSLQVRISKPLGYLKLHGNVSYFINAFIDDHPLVQPFPGCQYNRLHPPDENITLAYFAHSLCLRAPPLV